MSIDDNDNDNKQHFDGLVEAAGGRVGSPDIGVLAEVFGDNPQANARRIAAAWNICQGIDLATLEFLGVGALARCCVAPPVGLKAAVMSGYFVVAELARTVDFATTIESARAKAQRLLATDPDLTLSIHDSVGQLIEHVDRLPPPSDVA